MGGQVKFYPYKKRGDGKSFSHPKGGGGTTSFGVVLTRVVLTRVLEVLTILPPPPPPPVISDQKECLFYFQSRVVRDHINFFYFRTTKKIEA